MSKPVDIRFQTAAPITVPPRHLTPLRLTEPDDSGPNLDLTDDGVVFCTEGWYEVLMEVHWDAANRKGTRFSHTNIPGQEPL
ncbi:MAG: hypothetical protein JOZ41_19705, partial [Chloroflexi bacterium]|nr:hypothetical protein [Chloroflexota bacterium]